LAIKKTGKEKRGLTEGIRCTVVRCTRRKREKAIEKTYREEYYEKRSTNQEKKRKKKRDPTEKHS